jgi:diguanylate cyclase (GGDEF)-like protein/PAS domain S-box-containing protein
MIPTTAVPAQLIYGSYNYGLVGLSVGLAMVASFAALDLAGRITSTQGRSRAVWLACGATAMGFGIWSMHYVGMLALSMPMSVSYHVPTVLMSLLAAVAAAAVALFVVSQPDRGPWQRVAGSSIMGIGIAAMHYVGMAAMRCSAVISYNPWIVLLSLVLAVATSEVALRLAFHVREEKRMSRRKLISALVMGGAIPLMHYTGMWAASFRASNIAPDLTSAVSISSLGIVAITSTSFLVMGGAIASAFLDRFIALNRIDLNLARERELYFQTMAEAIPEIIWTATPDGADDYFNQKTFDYTGLTYGEMKGSGWGAIVHPDDLEHVVSKWQNALRTGIPYDVEYRLRRKDGVFRWFLTRANPIRDESSKIVKWFGSTTDIESQKQNQTILEAQILERTTQLAEANERLQEEMFEKDFARSELDRQNEIMLQELENRSKRATLLAKLGEHLQSCMTLDETFAAASGFAPKIFPTVNGSISILNANRHLFEVIATWGTSHLPTTEFEANDCWALRTGHPHSVSAGDLTAPCRHAAGVSHSYHCIPILAQGESVGVLHLQATDEVPQLNSAELSFKTTFAGQIGLSIANIKLREELRTQSVRDALTGLYNRRYLEEALERELRRATRAGQSVGILMLDLDHFKEFNDTHGHDAGDTVLREAAAFLMKNVRAEDLVCRFGGEEFVIILPTADIEGARTRAERLCEMVKKLSCVYLGQQLRMVTFSGGVAAFPLHGKTPQELMAAADAALYEAKAAGRDRIVAAKIGQPGAQQKSAAASA